MKTNVFYLALMTLMMLFFISVLKTEAQVTIGKDEKPAGGALLDLKEYDAKSDKSTATKGVVYPRVALTELNELYPMYSPSSQEYKDHKSELKARHKGLTVYNVSEANGFNTGLHVWDGTSWVKPVTELPTVEATQVNIVNLWKDATPGRGGPTGLTNNVRDGTLLKFGDSDGWIIIPEDGSYAFNFRLSGRLQPVSRNYTGVYYLSIWGSNSILNRPKDIAEISLNVILTEKSELRLYSYSVLLGAFFHKDEKVSFRISCDSNYDVEWKLLSKNPRVPEAKGTSLMWWKL